MFKVAVLAGGVFGLTLNAPEIVTASDPEKVAEIMREEGYRAKIERGASGQQRIETGSGGYTFILRFTSCDDGYVNCEVIVLSVAFTLDEPVSLERINEWNSKNFCQAWIDTDGDAICDLSVVMRDGVTRKNFIESIELFTRVIADFDTFLYGEPESTGPSPGVLPSNDRAPI